MIIIGWVIVGGGGADILGTSCYTADIRWLDCFLFPRLEGEIDFAELNKEIDTYHKQL